MSLQNAMGPIFIVYFFSFINISSAVYCPLIETPSSKLDAIKTKNYYECPGKQFPKHYTECCADNQCCHTHHAIFYEIDQNLAFMIALCISLLCFLFSIFMILCCFCPSCPLYNSCKARYTRDDAGCADKMGEIPVYTNLMPIDSPNGNTIVIAHPLRDKPNGFINNYKFKEAAV